MSECFEQNLPPYRVDWVVFFCRKPRKFEWGFLSTERIGAYMDLALEADIASQGWGGYGSEWE